MEQRRTAIRFVGIQLQRIRSVSAVHQGELFATTEQAPSLPKRALADDQEQRQRWQRLLPQIDLIRMRHGHGALLRGSALALQSTANRGGTDLQRDRHGLILRTSCLTR